MKLNLYLLGALFLFSISILNAQSNEKPNLAFQQVTTVGNTLSESYQKSIYETLLNKLVTLNKFNMVNRSPEIWKTIEKELELQDFIEPSTAVNLGKMLGAQYYVDVAVTQFNSDRVATKTTSNTIDYYFTSSIQASLKIVNLETGIYSEAVTSKIKIDDSDREVSITRVIQAVCEDLAAKTSQRFPIHAQIVKLTSPNLITLNQGELNGVKPLSFFKVLSLDKSIGVIKIVSVGSHEAVGRLLAGDISSITMQHTLLESFDENKAVVKIEKKEKQLVILNAGSEMGIKKGDVFDGTVTKEIKTEDRTISEEKVVSRIYITEVNQGYSKGKIINGYAAVQENGKLTESKNTTYKKKFLKLRYKSAIGASIKPNAASGIVSVTNETGDYNVDTQYLADFEEINDVKIISAGLGGKNLVKDLSTTLTFDFYDMAPLKNWIAYVDVSYEYPVVQERFFVSMGGSLGYGRLKQKLPDNVVETISNGQSNDLRSSSVFLGLNVGIVYEVKSFSLLAGISYDYLSFKKWKYEVDIEDETEKLEAPENIIPYSTVDLSGFYYNVGIRYTFKN